MANIRRLARSIAVDVSTDNSTWLRLPGRTDNAPAITPNLVDSTDVDTNGWTSSEVTLQSGKLTVKYNAISSGGVMNPAQELCRATQGQFADAVRLYTRYYDTDGGNNGFTFRSVVGYSPASTDVPSLMSIQIDFTVDGTMTQLTPSQIATALASFATAVPVVTGVSPSGQPAESAIAITGVGFSGTTGASHVTIGGTNATSYTVINDNLITAVMPAGSAGSAPVIVTNANGASTAFPYTRT